MLSEKGFMISLETKEGDKFNFFGTIHGSSEPGELRLSPENFYKKLGGKIPEGIHYEIEWSALPIICKNVKKSLIHIHEEGERNFIFWTKQILTEKDTMEIMELATLGMLYGAKTGKDFADLFVECGKSMSETIKKLSELCNLKNEAGISFNSLKILETLIDGLNSGKTFGF